jgi:hypothetical protein
MKERRRVKNQNSEKDIYLVEITLTAILVRGGGNWWKASSLICNNKTALYIRVLSVSNKVHDEYIV